MTRSVSTVGFVGLGNMGVPMSRRLVDAGHTVIGYDVSVQARQRAAAFGVLETGQLEEVATGAELVILILPNSDVVESVLTDQLHRRAIGQVLGKARRPAFS